MAGIEALGTVAAALQLAEASIKIASIVFEIYRSRPPETIRSHLREISSLQELANFIKEDTSLQTTIVQKQLDCILSHATALYRSLEQLYRRVNGSYWSYIAVRTEERDILRRLVALERQKATLSLYLSTAQANTLSRIDSNVNRLVKSSRRDMSAETKVRKNGAAANTQVKLNLPPLSNMNDAPDNHQQPKKGKDGKTFSRDGNRYNEPENSGYGMQDNGNIGEGAPQTRNDYIKPANKSIGSQVNGNQSSDYANERLKTWKAVVEAKLGAEGKVS